MLNVWYFLEINALMALSEDRIDNIWSMFLNFNCEAAISVKKKKRKNLMLST